MGADLGGVGPGDVVAVWGAGAVGQVAARAAVLLGAERVVVIDRYRYRLDQAATHMGAEVLDYTATDVGAELREMTAGRGPDVCIEAVGMEAHSRRDRLRDPLVDLLVVGLDLQRQRVALGEHPARRGEQHGLLGEGVGEHEPGDGTQRHPGREWGMVTGGIGHAVRSSLSIRRP